MYVPNPVPLDTTQLIRYLEGEFRRINVGVITGQEGFKLDELNAAPDKPRNGLIVYADGTNWNPGSGEGYYGYEAGAWVKL